MFLMTCYDETFRVDGPAEVRALLHEKGFAIEPSQSDDSVPAFRFEKADEFYNLYEGEELIARQQPLALLCEIVAPRVHAQVAKERSGWTFLRADVVKTPDGGAVLLAGSTLTGKTRLAQAMVDSGGQLWSRFFAVVNDSGEVLRYPNPTVPEEGLELTAVCNLVYRPDSEWLAEQPSPGQAAMHLLSLVTGGEESVSKALPRLAAACMKATVRFQGQRGPAEQALQALSEARAWPVTA